MNNNRRTVLPPVARDRATPHEAERLPATRADGDEAILRFAICIAVAWIALPEIHGFFGGPEHTFTLLQSGPLGPAHYALACITYLLGGVL